MQLQIIISLMAVVITSHTASVKKGRRFPEDFIFGTSTSAYQIEGAWNEDGKGENMWDHMTHTGSIWVDDQTNGDVAADSYHNYKRDVEMMRELGLDAYRFSISWSRILPNGFSNRINQAGIDFYNNYINEMLKYNITPMATLYHWDLPERLQDLGGFANPQIADWFEDYARIVFENFGDRVKVFITFNELRLVCDDGSSSNAEVIITKYMCAKNLVLAHARAYHLYNDEFKAKQGGQCGITLSVNWFVPATDSEADMHAVEINRQADFGIYSEPIFGAEGGFPKEFFQLVARKSKQLGFSRSQMPDFTDEERIFVRGSTDFFGVNHYTGFEIQDHEDDFDSIFNFGSNATITQKWTRSASKWLHLVPNSLYNTLSYLRDKYNDPIFYITENGWSTPADQGLIDDDRILYYRAALENVLDCLDDGIKLKGYLAWTLMDNFEWIRGYKERFGLYQVDLESPARTRTPRKSAFVYKEIIRSRTIDHTYEPDSMVMTIDEGH